MDDKGGLEHSLQDRDGVGVTLAHPTGSSWDTAGVFSLDDTPQRYQVILSIWVHLPSSLLLKLFSLHTVTESAREKESSSLWFGHSPQHRGCLFPA